MTGLYMPLIARYMRKAGTKGKHKLTLAMLLRRLWRWLAHIMQRK